MPTVGEIVGFGVLALMILASLGALLFCYLMLCELRHSIADIMAAITFIRDNKNPADWRQFFASAEPVKKGDVKFHVPRGFFPPVN